MIAFFLPIAVRTLRDLRSHWMAARQRRRDATELARLSAYELRDLGLSHKDVAMREQSACRAC